MLLRTNWKTLPSWQTTLATKSCIQGLSSPVLLEISGGRNGLLQRIKSSSFHGGTHWVECFALFGQDAICRILMNAVYALRTIFKPKIDFLLQSEDRAAFLALQAMYWEATLLFPALHSPHCSSHVDCNFFPRV